MCMIVAVSSCTKTPAAVALSKWARLRIGDDAATRYMSIAKNSECAVTSKRIFPPLTSC
jgi:hypothetical protein